MKPRDLLPNLPHEGPPLPRFLTQAREEQELTAPGCVCAKEIVAVLGYLNHLAEGWGGFGVLRTGREELEHAAEAARELNEDELALEIEAFAEKLPLVVTESLAKEAASELKPIARKAWELGKHCKGGKEAVAKALALGKEINTGDLTREEAVERLLGES